MSDIGIQRKEFQTLRDEQKRIEREETNMDVRSRRGRDSSPDHRVKSNRLQQQQQRVSAEKKVQVVYYLTRNGQLEHPHYLEITHEANQPLRLKDILDRLLTLRGKGMLSLYSWSCKRIYKSGYVWFDLAENDIIYPSEGAEYVLKGSELIEGSSDNHAERFQHLNPRNRQACHPQASFHLKGRAHCTTILNPRPEAEQYVDLDENPEEEYEDGEKTSYTSSTTTPHSRCSRGVSTDELDVHETVPEAQKNMTELNTTALNYPPPPPPASIPFISADHVQKIKESCDDNGKISSKLVEALSHPASTVESSSSSTRNSVLLQLIPCGGASGFGYARTKLNRTPATQKDLQVKRSESLQRGVVFKVASKVVEEGDHDMMNIKYMSENPRFGNMQSEEKEYFSGSIVESISTDVTVEPVLKKSNSYNEERSTDTGRANRSSKMEEGIAEGKKEKTGSKVKCLPRKILCSTKTK